MTFHSRTSLAAALCLAFVTPALAGPPANLRVYMLYDKLLELSMDGVRLGHMSPMQVYFFHAEAGPHTFNATGSGGENVSEDIVLGADDAAPSRGRSWWCISAARLKATETLDVLAMARDDCQKMADVAPADDVPDGH